MLVLKSRVWSMLAALAVLNGGYSLGQTAQQQPATLAGDAAAIPGAAQGNLIPPEAVWYATINVKRFVENPLGQQLLGLADQAIREEANDLDPSLDLKTARAKIAKVVGFDPLEGIASVTIYGTASPFEEQIRNEEEIVEKMATTGVAVVTLSGDAGNLEGLALATPEYESTKYKDATIHSGKLPDFPPRVYMAVLKASAGKPNIVVLGLNEDQVKQALDQVTGNDRRAARTTTFMQMPKGTLMAAAVKLDEKTLRALGVPRQQSAVVKMVQHLALVVAAEGDSVTLQVAVDVINDDRAEQFRQLLEGLIAFVHLPIQELEEEEEFLLLREVIKDVKVTRTGTRVVASLTKPADTLLKDVIRKWTEQRDISLREAIEAQEKARAARERARVEAEKRRERAEGGPSRR